MLSRRSSLLIGTIVMSAVLAGAPNASAAFQMRFEQSGFAALTITDNGPGDVSPAPGAIVFIGSYGSFNIHQAVGVSKPAVGNGTTKAEMDLNALTLTGATGGTLVVTLADTDFSYPNNPITMVGQVGGTLEAPAGSSVSFQAWANPSNLSPLATTPTTIPPGSTNLSLGTFSTSFYVKEASTTFSRTPGAPYSVFKQVTVLMTGAGRVGFDYFTALTGAQAPSTCLVIIDEDGIDNDMRTIEEAAYFHAVKPDYLVNDDRPTKTGNPWLRWNERFAGDIVKLPTGQVEDEGWFALPPPPAIRYADSTTTNLTYEQWIQAFVDGTLPQDKLDKVRDVLPLRNQELVQLVGRTCVAIVYDSDISINYYPLYANLQGERYGKFAFTVLAVEVPGSLPESGSSRSLYDLWVRVEGPLQAAAPLLFPLHEKPDSIQTTRARYAGGVLTVWATSGMQPSPFMTVSVDGPDAGSDPNVPPFILEAPMTFNSAMGRYQFSLAAPTNLVGRRVVIQTNEGGAYNDLIKP